MSTKAKRREPRHLSDDALNAAMAIVHHLEPQARSSGTPGQLGDGRQARIWEPGPCLVELLTEAVPPRLCEVSRRFLKVAPTHAERFNLWLRIDDDPGEPLADDTGKDGEPVWIRRDDDTLWFRALSVLQFGPAVEVVHFIRGPWEGLALAYRWLPN
jgi:hypothetical protein